MIQINQLKVLTTSNQTDLKPYIAKALRISQEDISDYKILKRSIDARKKPQLYFIYSVAVALKINQDKLLRRFEKNPDILPYKPKAYIIPKCGGNKLVNRPVVIGAGPAGLFAAFILAKAGFNPLIIERGSSVENRTLAVEEFWASGRLNPLTNVQFGEGGAGAFSDGKLNTLVKDKTGKNAFVLQTFVNHGAPEQILWDAKPHIGTDILVKVIANLRQSIISLGGEFFFDTQVKDFIIDSSSQRLRAIVTDDKTIEVDTLILAIGHSARDTFFALNERHVPMSAKEFAVGLRVEHPQSMIDESQYASADTGLPPSPYKLAKTMPELGRGVYSFCMCPGGFVVNASSEEGKLAVNGMSYSKRDSGNANSAIVVSVGAREYSINDPMGAIGYQQSLEAKAYSLAQGKIPQQLYGDFKVKKQSLSYGDFSSNTKGQAAFADLSGLFSEEINYAFIKGMEAFGAKIKGFDRCDAILSGVESRTSSPVRIHRNDECESEIKGLYPCGEGAGYAGGIMSAAMDGIKVAEAIISKYQPR